jgi:hypothetical protein
MHLVFNMAKIAKSLFSCTRRKETQYLVKNPLAEVIEEKTMGVEFPAHTMLKDAMARHLAIIRQNNMDGGSPRPNGTAMNPQTCWRR